MADELTTMFTVTEKEAWHLHNLLSNEEPNPRENLLNLPVASSEPVVGSLIKKVGSVIRETQNSGVKKAEIPITEAQLWILRTKVKADHMFDNEQVGRQLVLKIYEGISLFDAMADAGDGIAEMGETEYEEPGKAELASDFDALGANGSDGANN